MTRIQGRLRHIEQLLRAAHKFDTRAIHTLAQVAGTLDLVSAEIMELMTNVAAHTKGQVRKKK
jgi:hypothetical protein